MFRLIHLHVSDGVPRIGVDADGYPNEPAALARYREVPGAFGVGRFDIRGRLVEVILGSVCGPTGVCPRPASLVHAATFQRLCDTCADGLRVLTVTELGTRLGVSVRLAPVLARSGRHAAPDDGYAASTRIAREFAGHVDDPAWRRGVCAELAGNPGAVNGLIIGVGALSHADVLNRYPALRDLGTHLPASVQDDLVRARFRPLSPAGIAALRLWL